MNSVRNVGCCTVLLNTKTYKLSRDGSGVQKYFSKCVLTNRGEIMISEYKMGPIILVALTAHNTHHTPLTTHTTHHTHHTPHTTHNITQCNKTGNLSFWEFTYQLRWKLALSLSGMAVGFISHLQTIWRYQLTKFSPAAWTVFWSLQTSAPFYRCKRIGL